MCTLSCALIVCTLVSTARAVNNKTTVVPNDIPDFNSTEEELFNNWISTDPPSITPSTNEKYGSKTTLSTPSVMDPNDFLYPEDNAIDSSTKPGNDYIPSDKNSYTTEPILTTNNTQSFAEPPTRTHPLTTTPIANETYGSTKTPGTPSNTDLNDTMLGNDASVSPTEDVTGNSEKPTNDYTHIKLKEPPIRAQLPSTTVIAIWKNGSTTSTTNTESISTNDYTWPNPVTMRSKTKWSTGRYPFFSSNTGRPTRYYRPTEWIKPTKRNCTCVFCKHLKKSAFYNISILKRYSKTNEKETTTTNIWMQSTEYKQWNQQRYMRETTTSNVEGQLEKSQKWKLQQKVLEMESDRTNAILDILNSRK